MQRAISREECVGPIIATTILLYIGFLASIVCLYFFFAPYATCSRNIAFVTFTLLLAIAVTALSVSSIRIESAGLLTAALISMYGAWLCASALYSAPLGECSPLSLESSRPHDGTTWITVR